MPKVSILVPIYNVEKYIKECLDSLVNQTLEDIEIICINDGSIDRTLEILRYYENKDKRIIIINKENSGYGKSMNVGLDIAKGEFIGIVEPDDFVELNMYENLYKLALENGVDIVKSDFYNFTTSKNIARKNGKIVRCKTNCVTSVKEDNKILSIPPSIWSAIYNREFINKNNIRFLETPGASYQDNSFMYKTLLATERIYLTQEAYLWYRRDNENSSVKNCGKVYMICEEYEEITNWINKHPEIKSYANNMKLINQYNAYMWNLERISEEYVKDFIDKFSSTFKKFFDDGEITKEFYKKINKKQFNDLLFNKSRFYKYVKKLKLKKQLKNIRSKLISIHINSSRINIMLFGKQIIKIE